MVSKQGFTPCLSARHRLSRRAGAADVDLPMGVGMHPKEIFRASRRWAGKHVKNLAHWNDLEKGGHFAAWEQPELFVKEIRDCFRQFR